jgi:S1-C subfamily serine protease
MLAPGLLVHFGSAAMKPRLPAVPVVAWVMLAAMLASWLLTWSPPAAAAPAADQAVDLEARSRLLQRAQQSVLGVQAVAVDEARSANTLGKARSGSGVVIGADGLVLTIGYLVLEAEDVALVRDDGRLVPARVLAYDVATGFGLLQALAPLGLEPVPLGRSAALAPQEPLMIASGGGDGAVSVARLVSRRAFAGYWEYHIEGALFTAPPRRDHSGAGLFNGAGELVGVGSLLVADAAGSTDGPAEADAERPRRSGNLFVPVDLLTPILAELRSRGFSAASRRAWLGMNCAAQDGRVRVVRVSDDSPADVAGLEAGDRILRIDGTAVSALDQLWKALWAGGAPEREIRLDIERGGAVQTLTVFSVDRMKTLKRAEGI